MSEKCSDNEVIEKIKPIAETLKSFEVKVMYHEKMNNGKHMVFLDVGSAIKDILRSKKW